MDSQAKYGALARGDGAIFLRIPHKGYIETVWDHAAGSIIVTGMIQYSILENSERSISLLTQSDVLQKLVAW
jgi:hypothetical protein